MMTLFTANNAYLREYNNNEPEYYQFCEMEQVKGFACIEQCNFSYCLCLLNSFLCSFCSIMKHIFSYFFNLMTCQTFFFLLLLILFWRSLTSEVKEIFFLNRFSLFFLRLFHFLFVVKQSFVYFSSSNILILVVQLSLLKLAFCFLLWIYFYLDWFVLVSLLLIEFMLRFLFLFRNSFSSCHTITLVAMLMAIEVWLFLAPVFDDDLVRYQGSNVPHLCHILLLLLPSLLRTFLHIRLVAILMLTFMCTITLIHVKSLFHELGICRCQNVWNILRSLSSYVTICYPRYVYCWLRVLILRIYPWNVNIGLLTSLII